MAFIKNWFSSTPASPAPASPQSDGTMPDTKTLQEPIPEAEADEVLPENNRSLLAQVISANSLSIGMDLSKIVLPTFILEPRSLLAKLGDCMAHAEIFASIPDAPTPELRMVKAVEWFLTSHHKRPKGVKKPYNPVLGETFHCKYTPHPEAAKKQAAEKAGRQPSPEGAAAAAASASGGNGEAAAGTTTRGSGGNGESAASPPVAVEWYAQQVSHHPPISAVMTRSTDGRVIAEGIFAPKTRFLGNSASLTPDGCCNIFLPEHKWEMYSISWPTAYVRGLIMGAMVMELGGTVRVRCGRTGMGADIEFVTKGMFTGSYHQITGTIFRMTGPDTKVDLYKIEGDWTEAFTIKDIKDGNKIVAQFDRTKAPLSTMEVLESGGATPNLEADAKPPEDDSDLTCMWDAEGTWAKVTAAISKGDQEGATETKTAVENHQRRLRTRREEKKIDFKPSLFKPGANFKAANGSLFQLWNFQGPGALSLYELAGFVKKE